MVILEYLRLNKNPEFINLDVNTDLKKSLSCSASVFYIITEVNLSFFLHLNSSPTLT